MKSKIKKTISKFKGRVAAGLLAGSILLTGGLTGCAQRKDNENDETKDLIETMQIQNKSNAEQIALLMQEIENLKAIPTANSKKLEKLEELLTKLEQSGVSEEEFAASIEVLMGEIKKQSDETANRVLEEIEKNQETTKNDTDLMAVLTTLNEEILYGTRNDFETVFLQAERIETAIKSQKANNQITEEQYGAIEEKIFTLQSNIIKVALYNGYEKLMDKTGFAVSQLQSENGIGEASLKIAFGSEQQAYAEQVTRFSETTSQMVYIDSEQLIGGDDNEVEIRKQSPSGAEFLYINDFASEDVDLHKDEKIVDIKYSITDGYEIDYDGDIKKGTIQIKFAKDGSLQKINHTCDPEKLPSGQLGLAGGHTTIDYKFASMSQAEFENFCQSIKNELLKKLENQQEQ